MGQATYTLSGDAPDITPGALMHSKAGSWWRVLAVRPVKTRDGARRFRLMLERLLEPPVVKGEIVYSLQWHSRKRKPRR